MGLDREEWLKLIKQRSTMSEFLTHLVRGETDEKALDVLLKILKDKKIRASFGKRSGRNTVHGKTPVVCFQDLHLDNIRENIEIDKESRYTRYSPFGIQIEKITMFCAGARPVIYGKSNYLEHILPEEEYWRIVELNLSLFITDWTYEREWRVKEDFPINEKIKIIVKDENFKRVFLERYDEMRSQRNDLFKISKKDVLILYK